MECLSDFSLVQESIRAVRNIRAEKGVKPGKRIPARISAGSKTAIFERERGVISALAQLDPAKLAITAAPTPKQDNDIVLAIGEVEIHLPLEGLVDLDEEHARLTGALQEAEQQVERLQKLLGSSFSERAPAAIVQKEREKLAGYQATMEKLKKQLNMR